MARKRRIKSVKTELVKKAREAMLAAVQLYNNPQVTFKAESFITLAIIGWTYMLHAYYRSIHVDYRYYRVVGKKKVYDKTKYRKCTPAHHRSNHSLPPMRHTAFCERFPARYWGHSPAEAWLRASAKRAHPQTSPQ